MASDTQIASVPDGVGGTADTTALAGQIHGGTAGVRAAIRRWPYDRAGIEPAWHRAPGGSFAPPSTPKPIYAQRAELRGLLVLWGRD